MSRSRRTGATRAALGAGLVALAASSGMAQVGGPASRTPLDTGSFAFTNVHVVTMTSPRPLEGATVVVCNGRITAVGLARNTPVPRGVRVIDARGKYLMPGLADMHAHLYSDGETPDSLAPVELGVMLANGVTAVRLMGGTPEQLTLRDAVMRGRAVGPQLWLTSPMLANRAGDNARVVTSPDDARAAVREAATSGYDFIKLTFGITGDTYDAVVNEAKTRRIPVVGHVEPALGLQRAVAAGQQLEHLDAFFEAALADSAPMKVSLTQGGVYRNQNWASLDYIDERKLMAVADEVARSGVWVGPTLEVFNRAFSIPLSDEELHALPDWNMIPPAVRTLYVNSRNRYWAQPIPRERRARHADLRNRITKRIADSGGRILAGSDTPDLLMVYGFGLHREMQALVTAGLTPYQALAAATRNPAEFVGALSEWGTIEKGKRADLVLVDANPLEDIRNTTKIESVVIGGKLFTRPQLAAMIAEGTRALDGAPRN